MKKLILLLLLLTISFVAFSQTINCKDNDICVVQFNAGWNEANKVTWLDKLTDCGIKYITIDSEEGKELQNKFKIVVVPTLIVFNGEEVERFQADLSFKMAATREEVQEVIDETLMDAF
jgi:thioredoxin-related protein